MLPTPRIYHAKTAFIPFLHFNGEMVAEVVNILGITLCQGHVICNHVNVQNPIFIICPQINGFQFHCFLLLLGLNRKQKEKEDKSNYYIRNSNFTNKFFKN